MKVFKTIVVALLASGTSAFTTTSSTTSRSSSLSDSKTGDFEKIATSKFSPAEWLRFNKPTTRCGPCPDDDVDDDDDTGSLLSRAEKDMDRREAAFALLGSLWATTAAAATLMPSPANAVYGAEPKIELPNMMENMANRASNQCLVESLGNRECLVWMDPDNKLYQGVDTQKLLQKIDTSSIALTKIPELVEAKKWMGVKGIIAGPMGELLTTMNLLAPKSTQLPERSSSLAKQVKVQIFAIDAAADKKDGKGVLKASQAATEALVAFVKSL